MLNLADQIDTSREKPLQLTPEIIRVIIEADWWNYMPLDPRRADMVTASDIRTLMHGTEEQLFNLYLVKTRQKLPEDLSDNFQVGLGKVTTGYNLWVYERLSKSLVTRREEFCIHPQHPWFACTLDGFDDAIPGPVDAKHVGGREPVEVIVDRYQPQMQAQMAITGAKRCALSIIMGTQQCIVEYLERDEEYAAEMIRRGKQFMDCVRNLRPPVVLPPVPSPIMATKVYDWSTDNRWCDQAGVWLENREAAERCKDAEKTLKSFVPDDAKKVHGGGVFISRDRAGRLSLRESK